MPSQGSQRRFSLTLLGQSGLVAICLLLAPAANGPAWLPRRGRADISLRLPTGGLPRNLLRQVHHSRTESNSHTGRLHRQTILGEQSGIMVEAEFLARLPNSARFLAYSSRVGATRRPGRMRNAADRATLTNRATGVCGKVRSVHGPRLPGGSNFPAACCRQSKRRFVRLNRNRRSARWPNEGTNQRPQAIPPSQDRQQLGWPQTHAAAVRSRFPDRTLGSPDRTAKAEGAARVRSVVPSTRTSALACHDAPVPSVGGRQGLLVRKRQRPRTRGSQPTVRHGLAHPRQPALRTQTRPGMPCATSASRPSRLRV